MHLEEKALHPVMQQQLGKRSDNLAPIAAFGMHLEEKALHLAMQQ